MSIAVKNLTKRYGDQKAVDDISFILAKGEIVGLLGPNGAGKTTTMKILSGFISQFEGSAEVEGLNVGEHPFALKKMIGYLPEHNPLYLDMYVREYLEFIASIYKVKDPKMSITKVITRVGLASEQHKKISALSKGYRQRVGLAQALIHEPQVLILDEPTSGLDPNQLVEIRQLIRSIGQERTVIFSSHIMQEVQALCNRVIILNKGKIVADDKIDALDRIINNQREICLELDRPLKGAWKINHLQRQEEISEQNYRLIFNKSTEDPRTAVFDFVVSHGCKILSMNERRSSVEDVFQKLTIEQ